MLIEPEIDGASIVMIGNFNPQIFHPFWFANYEIITEEAAENAVVPFIHPEISTFRIDAEFNVQVERNRFSIDRGFAPLIRVADVVTKVFGELLPHTPIGQVGINRMVHFNVKSVDERDRIGQILAPPGPWGDWGKLFPADDPNKLGGLLSMTMTQRNVTDRPAGWVNTKVEPSQVVGRGRGIFVEVNDHYDIARKPENAEEIVEIVRAQFDASMTRAASIINQIMSLKQ
jgi:hypothetical protein